MTRCTIVLPTTGDRGPLLPLVVGRMQQQTLADWELFVLGDGVDAATRATIQALCAADPRIRFFDHPKQPRRGEPCRHQALAQARGRIVAYSCDRDLWLPDHLERLDGALAHADWAHTRRFTVGRDGQCVLSIGCDLAHPARRRFIAAGRDCCIALSCVGHTLAAYRRLPHGWRETPPGLKTDHYMWMQFLADPALRTASVQWPTVLYFNRGGHRGLPTAQRHAELLAWCRRLPDAAALEAFRQAELERLQQPSARLQQALRTWFWWRPGVARQVRRVARRVPGAVRLLGLPP